MSWTPRGSAVPDTRVFRGCSGDAQWETIGSSVGDSRVYSGRPWVFRDEHAIQRVVQANLKRRRQETQWETVGMTGDARFETCGCARNAQGWLRWRTPEAQRATGV